MSEDVTTQPDRKFVYRITNRADAPNLIGPLNTHPYVKKAELNYIKLLQSQSITFLEIPQKDIDSESFQVLASSSSGLPVTFESLHPEVAITTPAGQVTILKYGTAIIRATQGGNSDYEAAPNYDRKLVVVRKSQTIEFGQLETVNLSDEEFILAATASSGLPITYSLSDDTLASLDGQNLTLLKGGQLIITASQEGNDEFEPAESVDLILNIVDDELDSDGDGIPDIADPFPFQEPQIITWGQTIEDINPGDVITLLATASSGLPVKYTSSNTDVALVSGSELVFIKSGQANITATQQGNENYLAASPVTQTLAVNKQQVMTWNQDLGSPEILDGNITLTAVVDTGLPIVYTSSDTSVATIAGNILTPISVGSISVTASQAGDATANPPVLPVSITKQIQIVDNITDSDGDGIPDSSDPYPNQIERPNFVWDQDLSEVTDVVTLTATSDSGTIVYELGNETLGTITGNVFTPSTTVTPPTPLSVGITATIAEDETYKTAVISKTITLKDSDGDGYPDNNDDSDGDGIPDSQDPYPNQQAQAIVWNDDLSDLNVGDTFTLTASAQTAVTYASSDTSIATISGNTLSLVAEGSATITATAEPSSDYFTATSVLNAHITTPPIITLVDTLNNLNTASAISIGVNTSQTVFAGGEQIIYTLRPALANEHVINFTATRSDTGGQVSVTESYDSAAHDYIYEFYIPTDMDSGTITISAEIETREPLALSINDDGKLEVSFDYPEFTSYNPDTRCYKILMTFYEDTYELRRPVWRPDAIGVHPENQRITFVLEDRPEFLSDASQVNGNVNQSPQNSHLESITVYHTANRATGSDIYGNASTYYGWNDYVSSTRVRAELQISSYEDSHTASWFDYSSGTPPPSAEIDLPDTNGNGIWDSLDWDDEFQYSLSGDIITGSFKYSDKMFLNYGTNPSNYPDGYPSISLRWTDDYNGSSDGSQSAWDGSLTSSYSEGELVNFTFNANSIYGGTLDHLNYRYPIHTDADKSKPIQFSLDFMYPSSYSSNMVRASGPRVADYNWDADGDSEFDALDVYTAERVGSNLRVTFPYREGVFGVTINQDYAVELTFKDENGSWVAWGVDWWTQGSNNYSDGEIITIEQPLPVGYEQYMNYEIAVEWAAGTGGGSTYGQHVMVIKTLPLIP